jgi:hypothetical protein
MAQVGVAAGIQRSRAREVTVVAANTNSDRSAAEEISKTAQLYFYDWEPNVIGANGKPASKATPINGRGPGSVAYGLTEYRAILRAAQRPAILRASDPTWTPGCSAAQIRGCHYGSWYLLDAKTERVLCGPEDTEHSLNAGDCEAPDEGPFGIRPVGVIPKAIRVEPGTVLIRALAVQAASGAIINSSPNSWFVLNDDAVLTGADLTNPQQGYSEATGPIPAPDVTFGFTSPGKRAFEELTAKIARRAREAQARRVPKQQALQHFAVVLDDQLIDVPAIDYTKYPEGLDAAYGSEIEAGFTVASGRSLASDLRTGPLPLRLVRLPRRNAI